MNKKGINEYNKMERKEAKKDGINPVRNSGRGVVKGDALSPRFLVDYKFNATSFQLRLQNWIKLQRDAWKEGQRLPIICIKFEDETKVGIIPWEVLKEIGLDGD